MKKIISTFFLLAIVISPFGVFAETPTTVAPAPSASKFTAAQLKSKLLSLKKKQIKTKTNLNINKNQVKSVIKKVKKDRTLKKAKIIKAKNKKSAVAPKITTTTVKP